MPGMLDIVLMEAWFMEASFMACRCASFIGAAYRPVRLRHAVRGEVARGFEIATPSLSPGQTGKDEEESKCRDPDTGNGVKISPEDALPLMQAQVEDASECVGLPRPPEIGTRKDEYDGPRGREFDDVGAAISHEEFSVEAEDDAHEARVFVGDLEDLQCLRMDVDGASPACLDRR